MDTIELNDHLTHNFHYPWSKTIGLESKIHTPNKDLKNLTHIGDISLI